jgi:type IV secretory pathway VirB10-like protein
MKIKFLTGMALLAMFMYSCKSNEAEQVDETVETVVEETPVVEEAPVAEETPAQPEAKKETVTGKVKNEVQKEFKEGEVKLESTIKEVKREIKGASVEASGKIEQEAETTEKKVTRKINKTFE